MGASLEKLHTLRSDLPDFAPGDTVIINYKVVEGDKERIQPFQGTVIGKRGSGMDETFTVRRVLQGIGVERVFPLQSPLIKSLKLARKGSVRRAKLNYIRQARGKHAKIKESKKVKTATSPGAEDAGAGRKEE